MVLKKGFGLIGCLLLTAVLILPTFAAATNVTTIQYAFWGNPTAIGVEKDIIEEFEKANPTIKVQPIAVAYNDYHTKLLTLIAGGQAPDVMRIDSYYFADFMKAKALKDISGLIKRDQLDMSSYYRAGLLDCMQKNRYYGLPWSTAPIYMMVNVKMFKEAGIPIPSPDWKYADFLKIARQLTKGSGVDRQYGYGFSSSDFAQLFSYIWGNGGDLFDKNRKKFTLDKPQAYQKIQELADLVKEGVFPDPAQFTTSDIMNRWVINHKLAMRIVAALEIISLQSVDGFEFEVLPFPGTDKFPRATVYKSNVVGISNNTKKEKAAWAFLKFLRGPGGRGEVLYMQAKRIPPTFDNPELWKIYADPNKSPRMVAEVTKLISQNYGHLLPLRSGWLEVQGILLPQLQRVYAGQISAAQAMKEIAPKIQEILDRTN